MTHLIRGRSEASKMHTRVKLQSLLVVVALAALFAQSIVSQQIVTVAEAAGNTFYVATAGNDSDSGTIDHPWRTIQKAANSLAAGDTVLIRGGVYVLRKEDEEIRPTSGLPDRYTTFKAYPGESVTIQGSYPSDPANDGNWSGIAINGKSYIRIEGLIVRGFHSGLACSAPGHHIVVQGNSFEYNSEQGVAAEGAQSGTKNACDYMTIVGNRIHHNGYYDNGKPATGLYEGWGSGISLYPKNKPFAADSDYSHFHSVITGNIIYDNYDGTGGDRDNEADHTDGNGIIIDQGGNFPPVLIENNVIFGNGGRCIEPLNTRNVWIIGNTCYGNGTDTLAGLGAKSEIGGTSSSVPLQNIHILNNIVYAVGNTQITYFPDTAPEDLDIRNNLWYGQPYRETYSPYGVSYVRSNPLFVNASSNPQTADFHLQPNSPAIAIGANVPGLQLVDYDNNPRPQARPQGTGYDAGAYEYTGPIVAPTPIPPTGPMVRKVQLPLVSKNQ
jgi:hypothetical protein